MNEHARFLKAELDVFRRKQFEKFAQRGLPTKKEECWKYSDVKFLQNMLPSSYDNLSVQFPPVVASDAHTADVIRLVFVNGYFSRSLSDTTLLTHEAKLDIFNELQHVPSYLLKEHDVQRYPFAVLNSALTTDGLCLHIPKNCRVDQPIVLLFLNTDSKHFVASPYIIIVADENSQLTIIEEHISSRAENYFMNAVTELQAKYNAKIQYYKIQDEDLTATHIGHLFLTQEKNSYIKTFIADMGSHFAREEIHVNLNAEGVECSLDGFYYPHTPKQQVDNYIHVDHFAAKGVSSMVYKGIVDDQSHAVFNGKVLVHANAQRTQTHQSNHNLLLAAGGTVNTKPELEIYADDVKCTHGATVGQLDTEMLFYLRSRGINKETALKLLTQAFIAEMIEKIADPFVKQRIQNRVYHHETV